MTTNNLQWKIGGEAGYGIMTTGQIFSKVCTRGGLRVFAYPEYPSLIRGGHNTFQVHVSDTVATSQIRDLHILVALNTDAVELHREYLVDGAALIYDPADFKDGAPEVSEGIVLVPLKMGEIVKKHEAVRVARNIIALGASFGLLNMPWELVAGVISDSMKPELVPGSLLLTKEGYDTTSGKYNDFQYTLEPREAPEQMVISGNDATALGALKAGMKFYAAYPMTPSSALLSFFATQENAFDLVVKQTEDEIAAMNMIIGAGFAGVRAMTGTSGGGYALMTEAVGMAGIAEVPTVTLMGQRPGPSTGLPTWGSQADFRFVLEASQGEFPYIVLSPGDVNECFYMAHEAFNLAEKYQCPVVLLLDKYNQASLQSVDTFDTSDLKINRGKLLTQEELNTLTADGEQYLRHKYTDDGISPRVLPGMKNGRHIASSYEHDEYGYTTEDAEETVKQVDKRFRKMDTFVAEDAQGPVVLGPEEADLTFVSWGSTKLPMMQMLAMAEKEGLSVNVLHFTHLLPLPVDLVQAAFAQTKKMICVEGAKTPQFEGYLLEKTGVKMDGHVRRYDGRPFYPEDLLDTAREVLNESV